MINLNYLTGISIISLGIIVFLAGNDLLDVRKRETYNICYTILIEESKYMLPFALRNYFMHVINWSKIKSIYLFAVSFWFDNSEKKEDNEKKSNRQLGYLRLKYVGLCYALILYALVTLIWHNYSRISTGYQFKSNILAWINTEINSSFFLTFGIDGLSLPFALLVVFIMPIVYFSNWTTVYKEDGYYVSIVGLLEWFLMTVFLVLDLIMFYIFFESILPPLFVMIGMYGASQKFRAGYYLFLYTLLGSLFMLLVFVKMGGDTATTYFEGLTAINIYTLLQEISWIVLFLSFSVKTPLVPVHIWLPLAHSDANVSGSIVLASIVLKLALYGFIRILIGIFTFATSKLIPFFYGLCSVSVLYSSFTTIRQFDLKVLVAYSSIAHMASSLLGTFSDTLYGLVGSIIFGLAHGFVSPGLFILVGAVLYDRCGSRIINYYRGLSNLLPFFALLLLLFVFGNMGVPLTGNFIGEFLSLLGAYQQNIFIASIGATSVILSAVYSIFMYNRVTGGALSPFVHTIPDIFRKEFYIILPLLVLTILLGVYPCFISYDVEFGLSNYLLFTIFPAVLMDKSENTETSSNPVKGNSDKGTLESDRDPVIQSNTPAVPEKISESSSGSGIIPNNTLESEERNSTPSDNEFNPSEYESSRPDDIYINLIPNTSDDEFRSDSDDNDADSINESKSVDEESAKSESDDSVKSDSEDDHEYEEISGDNDDDSNDSDDEKLRINPQDMEDDEGNKEEENHYYENANEDPEPPVANEDPPVDDEGNLTDSSIITNYSPSDTDRTEVEDPSSCSSYGSEGEGRGLGDGESQGQPPSQGGWEYPNVLNMSAFGDFLSNMFNVNNNNDNNDNNNANNDNNDNNDNENNENNENNDNNRNINNNPDLSNGNTPLVPHNTPEAQYTVPNQTPNPQRGLRVLAEPLPQPPVEENRNGEDNNEENNEENSNQENNGTVPDSRTTNANEVEDLYGTEVESNSNSTVEKYNSTNENKNNDKTDKDSNTNFNVINQERDKENQNIVKMKEEEEPLGFALRENDFINEWNIIIKIIDSFSHSLKELIGFLIFTGLTNLSTCIFFIFFMNKIYKMYSIYIKPILPWYQSRCKVWVIDVQLFIFKYLKIK